MVRSVEAPPARPDHARKPSVAGCCTGMRSLSSGSCICWQPGGRRLAQQRCPPPLPAGPGGRPRRYRDESLVLLGLVRTLWRLSYQDLRDWLVAWPALAFACGLPPDAQGRPCVPSASQQCRRGAQAGAPPCEMLLVVVVQLARRLHLISGRDLIIR